MTNTNTDDTQKAETAAILAALSNPMVHALMRAHKPLHCPECDGISGVYVGHDHVTFMRHIDHEDGCRSQIII